MIAVAQNFASVESMRRLLAGVAVGLRVTTTALSQAPGLRLEPANAPIDAVVIDHIERLSEN